jgi:hypothetical protein
MEKRKIGYLLAMLLLVAYAGKKPVLALCACTPGGPTADYEGSGSSCTQAAASAKSQGYAEADAGCWPDSVCRRTYNVETPCYWDANAQVYKEVGWVLYRCYVCQ